MMKSNAGLDYIEKDVYIFMESGRPDFASRLADSDEKLVVDLSSVLSELAQALTNTLH